MHSTDPAPGTVYLIHFDTAYKHARHYTGWTTDLDARLQAHRDGRGARLMEIVTQAGITWQLARTWAGERDRERAIKNRHQAPQLCPLCTPRPYPVTTGRAALTTATRHPAPILPQPTRLSPREQGLRMAEQFLAPRAAWSPDRLTASFDCITGPYHETRQHTPAANEAFAVFTQTVTSRITLLTAAHGPEPLRGHQ
jgi:predicted GIY-YIG superfamily endonuclease